MKTRTTLGLIAALTLSTAMLTPLPAFAGNNYWGQQQLELTRAQALRTHCMDAHGRCIESKMLGDNYYYRCPMRQLKPTDASGIQSGLLSVMFCE
ncbi:MAG: hypothetical protein HYX63_05980 [Gammaproteobacteria bacterium]|nr:hypothetical protein [Gammaproteobacteria bacterium]